MGRRAKFTNIYELFYGFSTEDIDFVLSELSSSEIELLKKRYGESLDSVTSVSAFDLDKLFLFVVPKVRRTLRNRKMCRDYLTSLTFDEMVSEFGVVNTMIGSLRFGLIDKKSFSKRAICEFLGMEDAAVELCLRRIMKICGKKVQDKEINNCSKNLVLNNDNK